ncbi:MAG: RHS repeat-associated core domain-containing protein, partial [Prolixibacteraceae bacterium]|nr:RHS repeat-associated core domain-containing protein [Prolixibacteraceae bacterium]
IPSCPAKPEQADIGYSYDERGNISNTKFLPANVNQTASYNSRGWVDMIEARNGDNPNILYFSQTLDRDNVGNITQQISQQYGQNSITQNYEYDNLYRLTHWDANGNDDVDFTYDVMGNRLSEVSGNSTKTYVFNDPKSSNRLINVNDGTDKRRVFWYNEIGAIDYIESFDENNINLKSQSFYFNSEGRVKRLKKFDLGDDDGIHCGYDETKAMSIEKRTVWQYRYSPLGAREQKRLLYTPKGDAICYYYDYSNPPYYPLVTERNHHTWEYYMLGAGGEQLAVYNGVQVKFDREDNETERFVYMYLHSFISAGGQLVTLADGTKQFNIVDNLGSVRCIVSWDGTTVSTQAFDYKPFGDLQSAGEENRIGYFGEQRDKESDYFAMAFRLYDPEIGRFLAIDPLLDMQPSQTPYHYCFNNPTSFTDPTGLYPEKEKGDKVQVVVAAKPELMQNRENFLEEFLSYQRKMAKFHAEMAAMSEAWFDCLNLAQDDAHYRAAGGGSGGGGYDTGYNGGGPSDRTGTGTRYGSMSYSINGVEGEIIYRYNEDQDKELIEKKIREGLDWQCKDLLTRIDLEYYFKGCNSICIDFTKTGRELGLAYGKGWPYLDGSSSNAWNYPDQQDIDDGFANGNGYTTIGLEDGFIYIASEFLNEGINSAAHIYADVDINNHSDGYYRKYDFNLVFGHETGHTLDATLKAYPIYQEYEARWRAKRQWEANNPGRHYMDEMLKY